MSPAVKKQWDDGTIYIFRLAMGVLGFSASTFFVMGINYIGKMSDKLDAMVTIVTAMEAKDIEKHRALDDKNAVQDANIGTLFLGKEAMQGQITELFRYHPKRD